MRRRLLTRLTRQRDNIHEMCIFYEPLFRKCGMDKFIHSNPSLRLPANCRRRRKRRIRRERNKVAASKCRQRRKKHTTTLQLVRNTMFRYFNFHSYDVCEGDSPTRFVWEWFLPELSCKRKRVVPSFPKFD